MSFLLISTSRTLQSSLSRQRFLLLACRYLPSSINAHSHQQADSQQVQRDYPTSPQPRRRYRHYLLSIAAGVLIGAAYTYRQSQKYEGLMPEYITDFESIERKAMEARPVPPPVTKHITFDSPPRVEFPFKLTLYQYVTWFVLTSIFFFELHLNYFVF